MDPKTEEATPGVEVNEALSPGETDGASSSDAVADAPNDAVDAIVQSFKEEHGNEETAETVEPEGDKEEAKAEPESEEKPVDAADDTQEPEKEEASAETDDKEDSKYRIPDDQFKALPNSVKDRLGYLSTRARKAERTLAAKEAEIAPLQDSHDRFTQLQTYVTENNIESKNVTLAFDAMAKLSGGDFQGFLDVVGPWYSQAQQAVGASISPDLQTRVDDGLLTPEDAAEMTKARVSSEVLQANNARLQEQNQRHTEAEAQGQESQRIVKSVNEREAELRSSDPDYAQKAPAIKTWVDGILRRVGPPKTSEDAVAMINEAHEAVTSSLIKPVKATPTPPRPSASQPPRGNTAPKTSQEAIFEALRGPS